MESSPPSKPSAAGTAGRRPAATWRAEGMRVTDTWPSVPAALDLAAPRLGIGLGGAGEPDRLLGLDLGCDAQLVDHWLRGDDVTAVYESTDERGLRATAMWRVHAADAVVRAWELVASAQTAVLETDAEMSVLSVIRAGDEILRAVVRDGQVVWRHEPTPGAHALLVIRQAGSGASPAAVLVAAHPAETGGLSIVHHDGRVIADCPLFSDTLEKGVLLRSRVLAACGPAGPPSLWAERLLTSFAAAAPILTT